MTGYRSLFDRIAALGGLAVAERAMAPVPKGTKAAGTKRNKVVTKPVVPSELVTPHTLRHSLASLAADLGYSEFAIAGLLGHNLHSVTSKYAHTADAVLLAAADAVENETAFRMGEPRVCAADVVRST
jgi:integrase